MLLLMFIGLFTSRIVLKCLGAQDYGTYNAVYSVIMMFTVLSGGVSNAVSRFLAFEIGAKNEDGLRKAFSSAVVIQIGMSILMVILAETLGLWYFFNKLNLPDGRMDAAMWVFQASVVILATQLMSLPFNCTFIAHEDMKAFAKISLLEGFLKLTIAASLLLASADKLKVYAVLMAGVAVAVRISYAVYSKKHFSETRGTLNPDRKVILSMLSFSAWSFTAQGVGVFNTQGVNLLVNNFFGVALNAARGIATQVETITRQFISNFLTALNPLIIKTWAEDNRAYCFELVRKGCKYSFLIALIIAMPFLFESSFILQVWLGQVPKSAPVFTTLAIFCVMADMMSNSLAQLILANGKIALYYAITSSISTLTFLLSWLAFTNGLPAYISYCLAITVLTIIAVVRLFAAKKLCGFPIMIFLKETVFPTLAVAGCSALLTWIPFHFLSDGVVKSLICISIALLSTCALSYAIALTEGERRYVLERLKIKK